jgi:hypothetical protein
MNVLETVAGAGDKELLRSVVEAAFFLFSGQEEALPGGSDFWTRMKASVSPPRDQLPPAEERGAQWKAVERLRRELDRHLSGRPDVRSALAELDRLGFPPAAADAAGGFAPARPAPAPPGGLDAEIDAVRRRLSGSPAAEPPATAPPPFAQVLPPGPKAGEGPETPRSLEEKLALYEEEARIARADLGRLQKKYTENLELLKEEARDRGSLQKELGTTQTEVARAQERLKEEQEKLADAHRRLEKRERELETLEERLHATELALVRKEEEIAMAMQHLRDEEAERRRMLDALRGEARDKAQMEHRLKRREEELSRLEARIMEEEKRIAALRGSQAISEEEAMRKAADLKRREEAVRAQEAQMRTRLEALRSDEEQLRDRVSVLKREMRDGELAQAQLKKREELRAALEVRYRQKEEELVRELRELERLKAGFGDAGGAEDLDRQAAAESPAGTAAPMPLAPDAAGQASPLPPARAIDGAPFGPPPGPAAQPPTGPAPLVRLLVVAPPGESGAPPEPGPSEAPSGPAGLFPETAPRKDRSREEIFEMLARKKKPK